MCADESSLLSGTWAQENEEDSGDFKMAINVLVSKQNSQFISPKSRKSCWMVLYFCLYVTRAEFTWTCQWQCALYASTISFTIFNSLQTSENWNQKHYMLLQKIDSSVLTTQKPRSDHLSNSMTQSAKVAEFARYILV